MSRARSGDMITRFCLATLTALMLSLVVAGIPVSAATPTPVPAPLVGDWGADGARGEIWAAVGNGGEQPLVGVQWRLWLQSEVAGQRVTRVVASGEVPELAPGAIAIITAQRITATGTYRFQALVPAGSASRDAWSGPIVFPPVGQAVQTPTEAKPEVPTPTGTPVATATFGALTLTRTATPPPTATTTVAPVTLTPSRPPATATIGRPTPPIAALAASATATHIMLLPLSAPAAAPTPTDTPAHTVLVPAVGARSPGTPAPAAASPTPGEMAHIALVPNVGAGPAPAGAATPGPSPEARASRASPGLPMIFIYAGLALVGLAALTGGFALVRSIVRKA